MGRQVLGTTGGISAGTGYTISSTVGEAVIQTLSSGNFILTQGFQQPRASLGGLITYDSKPESCRGAKNGAIIGITDVLGCAGPYLITDIISVADSLSDVSDINLEAGNYVVTVTGLNGCVVMDTLTIDLESDEECTLKFYSGITPNGDGRNDSWIIDNIDQFPENTVQIFNRWGSTVYSESNYDNIDVVWKGNTGNKEDGEELEAATYFYVATVDGQVYKGWVELTR